MTPNEAARKTTISPADRAVDEAYRTVVATMGLTVVA